MTADHRRNTLPCEWHVVRLNTGRSILQGGFLSWETDPPCLFVSCSFCKTGNFDMRRSFAILLTIGLLLFSSLALATGATAATTIGATTRCSNGEDNTGGLGLICQTTIVNTFTLTGGSAVVTVRECHGAAGDANAACATVTQVLSQPVTTVRQCNSSINGGGGTLRCSVRVVNNFIGIDVGRSAVTTN